MSRRRPKAHSPATQDVAHKRFSRNFPQHTACVAQIVSDLRTLRELADALLRYDAVTFLALLDTLRLSEGRNSVWLLHSAAHTIFEEVRLTESPG